MERLKDYIAQIILMPRWTFRKAAGLMEPFELSHYVQLANDPNLYLAFCYWEDYTATVETLSGIIDICNDIVNRSSDESYKLLVFDSNGSPRRPRISTILLPKIAGY